MNTLALSKAQNDNDIAQEQTEHHPLQHVDQYYSVAGSPNLSSEPEIFRLRSCSAGSAT